jgi:hypothetical protein
MSALGRSVSWPENPLVGALITFITLVLPVISHFTLKEN